MQNLKDFSAIGIDIELTDEGVKHVPEIIACVFSYVGMLRRHGPQEWVQRELQDVLDINFRFLSKNEPSSYATQLANNMQLFAPDHYVSVCTSNSVLL
jgi:secreted Zn-dependent insulinase-like peptidase